MNKKSYQEGYDVDVELDFYCPYQELSQDFFYWGSGFADKCIETKKIPTNCPSYFVGMISCGLGKDITEYPYGETTDRWVSGWLRQKDRCCKSEESNELVTIKMFREAERIVKNYQICSGCWDLFSKKELDTTHQHGYEKYWCKECYGKIKNDD